MSDKNRSYLNIDDELDDQEPYSSISSRDPLTDIGVKGSLGQVGSMDDDYEALPEDFSGAPSAMPSPSPNGSAPSQSDLVKNAILSRQASSKGDVLDDPLMQSYNSERADTDRLAQAKRQADFIGNMGLAASQIAQGTNDPRPNNALYENIASQNAEMMSGKEKDLDRKQRVIQAIEQRKSREGIAADSLANRQLMSKQHSQDLALRSKDKLDAKQEAQVNKWATQMKDDLDPNKARGGNLASNQKRVDNAQRIEALLSQVHNNPDPRQMEELAISSQALLSSSGTPAAEQVKSLIPHTALGNVNAFKEWLTNDPTGTGQQEFVKRMAETVQREKDVANQQVQKAQKARLSVYGKFKQADPETYGSILNAYGLGDEKQGMTVQDEQNIGKSTPVKMQAPDGSVRLVPADRVEAALAAGGKRL
jgi:hypothetical protein